MKERIIKVWSCVVYWLITIGVGLSIVVYLRTTINSNLDLDKSQRLIQEVLDSDASRYFLYNDLNSVKEYYALSEPIRMISERSIKASHQIGGNDFLMCDTFDGDWFVMISNKERKNESPTIGRSLGKRVYWWELPQNPKHNLIEANCYIKANLKMIVSVEGEKIEKKQVIKSNIFRIRKESYIKERE